MTGGPAARPPRTRHRAALRFPRHCAPNLRLQGAGYGRGRPGLAGHLKSAATIAAGWLVTSAAVGALAALRPGAGLVLQQTVYLSATALVGMGRYLVLRLAVFTESTPQRRTGGKVRLRATCEAAA
ncbi:MULTISPECIES: hypothetical protein [unclassified Streptomyces]|uniref:hypothetical protein n=1 Tax=unclassified Streptomyces TaxID=2593676 RepID=UPI002E2C1259|nr:hypothetical protein [Streptomyces sp. NBC_00228]